MTVEQLNAHGKRFSQSYRKGFGLWKDDFHSMAMKTVLKLMLSKYAPLSVDIQRAIVVDQAVIKDAETQDVDYVDAEEPEVDKELERICLMIEDCTALDELEALAGDVPDEAMPIYLTKLEELTKNG
jgi:recombination protein RecT